ncbi:hypothetical protein VNI00_018096 [Paramarasmius palmivorus]|uniref:Uncharacterized protein n=1 Tax=Paramarasmius palmivorus TaxID=297713 RepID=A0AAW0B150_9AGAR
MKPWDGLVGGFVEQYFVTSPNMTVLYSPPLPTRTVQRRQDYRYGQDDPLHWPQFFYTNRCHYAVIRRRPTRSSDPFGDWWHNPTEIPFVPDEGVLTGVGKLHHPYILRHLDDIEDICKRYSDYRSSLSNAMPNKYVAVLQHHLNQSYQRLSSLPMTLSDARSIYSFMQRCYLELLAALDWIQLYQPKMEGRSPVFKGDASKSNLMGAFVTDSNSATQLFHAGVPVWVVRDKKYHPSTLILQDALLKEPSADILELEVLDTSATPVYVGACLKDQITAMDRCSSRGVTWIDAFQATLSSQPPAAVQKAQSNVPPKRPGHALPSARLSKRPKINSSSPKSNHPSPSSAKPSDSGEPNNHRERDKFAPVDSPFAPPSPVAWISALKNVDRRQPSPPRIPSGYILPEHGLFLNVPSSKRTKYLLCWLKYRTALVFRATDTLHPPVLWRAQLWRTFLALDFTQSDKSTPHTDLEDGEVPLSVSTFSQKQRDVVNDTLSNCIQRAGVFINEQRLTRSESGFTWQQQSKDAADLDEPQLVREILWEMANISFRCEMLALDRARRLPPSSANRHNSELDRVLREDAVAQCFPKDLVSSDAYLKEGLAAVGIRDRAPYLLNLKKVMQEWKGADAQRWFSFSTTRSLDTCTDGELERLESHLSQFYAQSFFDQFARPCTLPHRPA